MKQLSFTISLFLVSFALLAQSSMPSLAGWKMQEESGRYRFTPVALLNNKTFIYEIMPPVKQSGQTIETWFRQAIEQDMEQTGYTLPAGNSIKINEQRGIYTFAGQVTDKNNKSWYLSYVTYSSTNGQYRMARMLSTPDLNYFTTNGKAVMTHFAKLAREDGFAFSKTAEQGTTDGSTDKKTTTTTSTTNTPKAEDFYTENGLKPAQIKGVVMSLHYRMGVGGYMYGFYDPYLMLADGSVYNDPSISPYKFDVAKSKQLEPKKWGTWREIGKTIYLTWPNEEKSRDRLDTLTKNWFWTRPATNSEKLVGSYKTISGGGNTAFGGNVMIVSAANLTFNNGGQFTMETTAGGSNSGDFGVSSTAYSSQEKAGTYLLNGYSIEMKFNSGKVQQQLFYFYPDSKDVFSVGGRDYLPTDETKKKKNLK
jgi:hypothetical protein